MIAPCKAAYEMSEEIPTIVLYVECLTHAERADRYDSKDGAVHYRCPISGVEFSPEPAREEPSR